MRCGWCRGVFFFFNDTATTEIYTLSLHDALPIGVHASSAMPPIAALTRTSCLTVTDTWTPDRKSTRLNSSHTVISYALFCLQKKNLFTRIEQVSGRQLHPMLTEAFRIA